MAEYTDGQVALLASVQVSVSIGGYPERTGATTDRAADYLAWLRNNG